MVVTVPIPVRMIVMFVAATTPLSPELIAGITGVFGLIGGVLPRVILMLVKSRGERGVKIEDSEAAYRAATFTAAKEATLAAAAAADKMRDDLREELKTTRDMLTATQTSERAAWDRVRQLETLHDAVVASAQGAAVSAQAAVVAATETMAAVKEVQR